MSFMLLRVHLVAFLATALALADVTAFVGARLLDGTNKPPIADAVLVVRDGRIEAVGARSAVKPPRDARIIDVSGKTITPGFHATHVHITGASSVEQQLGVYTRYGITTLWSLGGEPAGAFDARQKQDTPSLNRARLYLAGDIITGTTPDAARQMVAKVAATKPDILKIRVDDQLGTTKKMEAAVYKAIIDEAHKRGLRVAAHIFYLEDAKELLRSGVDMIAHSVRDKEIDDEFISLMKARNVPYCPTLTREISTFIYESTPAFFDDPFFKSEADARVVAELKEPQRQQAMRSSRSAQAYKKALDIAKRNLAKAAQASLLVVMGTDSGASANRFQGYFEHVEMQMMVDSGMSPQQVLRSATGDAARAMKLDNMGVIAKGAWADFNVFDRDPSADIANTKTLHSVWVAGNRIAGGVSSDRLR
jgi:imidazolonepropionase-like amidohydrolase